jgi:hypothetical protein
MNNQPKPEHFKDKPVKPPVTFNYKLWWLRKYCPNMTCAKCKLFDKEKGCQHPFYPGRLYTKGTLK